MIVFRKRFFIFSIMYWGRLYLYILVQKWSIKNIYLYMTSVALLPAIGFLSIYFLNLHVLLKYSVENMVESFKTYSWITVFEHSLAINKVYYSWIPLLIDVTMDY